MNAANIVKKNVSTTASETSTATPMTVPEKSLEELLAFMCRYGRPHLYCHDDKTWSATLNLDMRVSNTQFEVKSGFQHKTAISAAQACYVKLQEVLREMRAQLQKLEE